MSLSAGVIWLFVAVLTASFGYVVSGKMPGWEALGEKVTGAPVLSPLR